MKKIYIYSYSRMNLGDDIFVEVLCNRYENTKFILQCRKKHSKAFSKIENLKVIPVIPHVDRIFGKVGINISINRWIEKYFRDRSDGVVRIGGSIFMEAPNGKTNYGLQKAKYVDHHLPVFIIGANFGPYHTSEYLEFYRAVFRKLNDVCFRDKHSYRLFSELPNVRVAPDVLFCYPEPVRNNIEEKKIIISVIDLANRPGLSQYKELYQGKIAELCLEFASQNYRITLMSFCDAEGDKKAADEILKSVSNSGRDVLVEKYSYDGNIEEAISRISNSSCIIASRFHALILGWIMNKSVLPIIYSQKTENVIEDVGYKGLRIRIEDIATLDPVRTFNFLSSSNAMDIEKQKIDASKQFYGLDEFLNNQNAKSCCSVR